MESIIFYGAGYNARLKYEQWITEGLKPKCFADEDAKKQHTIFKSFGACGSEEIISLKEAIKKYPNYKLYVTLMPQNLGDAFRYLLDERIPIERICFLEPVTIKDLVSPYFLQSEKEKCGGNERGECPMPFFHPHIVMEEENIVVYPCAPPDHQMPIGVYDGKDNFRDFLNTGYGKIIRSKVKNRSFTDCPLITCASRGRYIEAIEYMENFSAKNGRNPLIIKFMHDFECNYHCVMCRDVVRVNDRERLKLLNEKIATVFIPMCENADAVYFAGNGDPFASRHYRALISMLAQEFPDLKFLFHTNGALCNKCNFEKLGIDGRVQSVLFSLNAATEETYRKVSPGANWNYVMGNVKQMADCVKKHELKGIYFSFVVQRLNYQEMPAFVELAKSYHAKCRFTLCHWEANSKVSQDIDNTVFLPNHPEFSKYCEILRNPIFDWDGCFLDPYSKYLRECCL